MKNSAEAKIVVVLVFFSEKNGVTGLYISSDAKIRGNDYAILHNHVLDVLYKIEAGIKNC